MPKNFINTKLCLNQFLINLDLNQLSFLFNQLPIDIINADIVNAFKNKLDLLKTIRRLLFNLNTLY